jgi:hypothetical protein
MLNDSNYLDTFGILECKFLIISLVDDPDINILKTKYKYRAFIKDNSRFINTLKIEDEDIIGKIHMNYRVIFLKDTAAARWIEETTFGILKNVNIELYFR